jgi:tetratricopeptide (TPR) repeat protein
VGGALLIAHGAGEATRAVTNPSGATTPSIADYSYEKSLVVRGQVDHAIHAYERRIAEAPEAVAPRLLAAELYRQRGDASRAATLLEEARTGRAATEAEKLQATNRLIDLYLGPMDRPEDARRELRYLIRAFPRTEAAAHALAALKSGALGEVGRGE